MSRVLAPGDLHQAEVLLPGAVLYPKIGSGQMPNFPQASSARYTDSGSGICHDSDVKLDAQISGQGLQSQTLGSALANPCQLGLG